MEVIYERCCDLDVHKRTVVACLLTPGPRRERRQETRTCRHHDRRPAGAGRLLAEAGCTHVAMEATGVYWRPVYNLLEGSSELFVVNAQHLRAVPGRRTDVRDAEWIADLLRHGLVRPSFVPSRPERELRELTRYRTSLLRERASEINRLQKVLEGANIKLLSVASNVVGVSGRAMITALIAGEDDLQALADLARGRLQSKKEALKEALDGRLSPHQRFLMAARLRHIDQLNEVISEVSAELDERLAARGEELDRLMTIPGVGRRVAETLLSEVGADMGRFPSARHRASWAGLCPGDRESAGKTRSGRTRKGSPWLRSMLVEAGVAAARTNTYLGARFRTLAAWRGSRRAAVALAHSIIVTAYHLLTKQQEYLDLGANYFDERQREKVRYPLTRTPGSPRI
jgi:transposase